MGDMKLTQIMTMWQVLTSHYNLDFEMKHVKPLLRLPVTEVHMDVK